MDSSEAVRRIDASAPLGSPWASLSSDRPYLAELVEGGAGDARAPAPQLGAGAIGELLGFGEAALELHDLGVVDAAQAGEG